jgi:transposase-like protein
MDGVVEIISGRERRRRWSAEDKLRLVAETYEPGAAIRAVAARHGVCESLLFTWRRQVREGVGCGPRPISPGRSGDGRLARTRATRRCSTCRSTR